MKKEIVNKLCNNIVKKLEEDISDRSGLGNEWELIDKSIQGEIKDEWKQIIKKELI